MGDCFWFCSICRVKVYVCNLNRESLTVVEKYFPQYALQEQDILGRKDSVNKVLGLVPDDILYERWCTVLKNVLIHVCVSVLLTTRLNLNSSLTCKKRVTAAVPEWEETWEAMGIDQRPSQKETGLDSCGITYWKLFKLFLKLWLKDKMQDLLVDWDHKQLYSIFPRQLLKRANTLRGKSCCSIVTPGWM